MARQNRHRVLGSCTLLGFYLSRGLAAGGAIPREPCHPEHAPAQLAIDKPDPPVQVGFGGAGQTHPQGSLPNRTGNAGSCETET